MSHELRTPMNAIIGYSEMLLEEAEEMEMGEFASDLKRIHGAGRHLLALINDVLDLSKIEAGKMDLYLESFELEDLIGEVDSTVQSLIAKKRNKFVVERGGELGEVTADLTKLRQVLFNLISNAAKFTEDGQITLAITPEVRSGVEWVTYAVSDTGIGIPPDKIGGLFEEFSQVDASTTRNFGGTGLGLSITKRFCEMMGGVIDVASEPGKGSTFSMRLPAEVRETAKPEIPEPRTLPEGACVLVIDDDPDACELIRRSLEQAGQKVAVATSGDEGLRLARKLRPVLITLDVLMPGKDGWAVLRELKADPDLKDTPVIMISMVDGNEMGYALGSTDFVSKPIDRNHLRKLLTRYSIVPDTGQVLVVDDDDNVRTLLRRLLEAEGFRVAEASDGKEALQRVNENQPDLIILDLMMPVMDGFQFAAELRAVEAWKKIPVVVSTARDLTADEHADLSGKVANILKKNATNVSDLMAQVQAFVDVHGNGA
jgi:CheY-like chemotaxis protein